jgi:hypothetical protein
MFLGTCPKALLKLIRLHRLYTANLAFYGYIRFTAKSAFTQLYLLYTALSAFTRLYPQSTAAYPRRGLPSCAKSNVFDRLSFKRICPTRQPSAASLAYAKTHTMKQKKKFGGGNHESHPGKHCLNF